MKYFIVFFLFFSHQVIWAKNFPNTGSKDSQYVEKQCEIISKDCTKYLPYASSNFFLTVPFSVNDITIPVSPQTAVVSTNRNGGFKKGNIHLTNNGVKINESGTYSISFEANLLNAGSDTSGIVVSLSENGILDSSVNGIGCIVQLPIGLTTVVQRTGIVKKLKKGTKLSILATVIGGSSPLTVNVVGWNISLFRIP